MVNFFSSLVPSFLREETYTPRVTLDNIVIPVSEEQQGVIAIPASSNLFSGSPIADTEENVPYPPDLPEKKLTDDTMTVPLSDNFIPGTSISAPVDDTGYEDMSSYVPSYVVTEDGVPVPPPLLSRAAQASDELPVGANIQVPVKPVPPSIRQETPLTNQADTGFNWRGVLDRVLSSMDDPENDEKVKRYASNVNQWVQDFGTSPFLALADPENAVHRLRQQANVNAELAAKRRGTTTPSAFMQKVGYLQGLGLSPEEAYNRALEDEIATKKPLVQVGGEGETAFDKKRGEAFADELSRAYESRDTGIQIAPHLSVVRSYLERNPNVSWGKLLSGEVEDFKQWFGLSDEQAQVARQALNSANAALRADNVKRVTGGGQVSNKEQEYLNYMLPGEDKTWAQNMYIIEHWEEINRRLNARLEEADRLQAEGAGYREIQKRWREMQEADAEYFNNLYEGYLRLGKGGSKQGSSSDGVSSGGYRVIRRID